MRRLLGAAATAAALAGLLTACSSDRSADGQASTDPTDAPSSQTAEASTPAPDSTASAAADPDTSTPSADDDSSAGVQNPDGAYVEDPDAYEDEPTPPTAEAQVLCNLSSSYLGELADQADADNSSSLALIVVALDDNIQVWTPLVGFHPEMSSDLDRAERVLDRWYDAMSSLDDGDSAAAATALQSADATISQIVGPSADLAEELGCVS